MERERKKKPFNFTILANDPSFTAWGWVIINHKNNQLIEKGCIKTESEHKKRRIRKGDDTTRRISEIVFKLLGVIRKYNVGIILSELPHGSQNASSAVMQGAVVGILQTLADVLQLPVEWYSEGDAKKHLLNKRSATKEETINAISQHYLVNWFNIKYKDEAVADAMAIYHVARSQSSILRM